MLEDIRPGDILEWSYTVEERPLLLSNYCASIFTLPAGAAVGKFYFSVRFDPSRHLQWRCSVPEWQPTEKATEDETVLTWTEENYAGLEPETIRPIGISIIRGSRFPIARIGERLRGPSRRAGRKLRTIRWWEKS